MWISGFLLALPEVLIKFTVRLVWFGCCWSNMKLFWKLKPNSDKGHLSAFLDLQKHFMKFKNNILSLHWHPILSMTKNYSHNSSFNIFILGNRRGQNPIILEISPPIWKRPLCSFFLTNFKWFNQFNKRILKLINIALKPNFKKC